jgi:glycolate dehydrogenase FAD-linked subunit
VPSDALGSDLRRLIGSDAVLTDEAARVLAGTDFITHRGTPAAVARPTSNDQVVRLLRYATKHGLAIVPRGTATNLSAAIAPGDDSLVLDLASMNRIVEIDAEGRRAVVEPGVINADLKAAAAPLGLVYAPDPASTPISTIGGNIAENAGGPGCIKYGVTFHHVLAVDVALADGRLVTFSDSDEVDLLGVTIGSEGILGVVTRAVLNLMPIPAARWALASFDCVEDAALTVSEIIAAGILPAALEICDKRLVEVMEAHLPSGYPTDKAAILIVELDGERDDVAQHRPALEKILRRWDHALRTAADEQERAALWAGRLAGAFAIRATGRAFYVCDATVPRQRVPEMMARSRQIAASHGLDMLTAGHAGDGNLHPTVLYEPDQLATVDAFAEEIADAALELGGTLAGEHGIGTAKRAQMRRVFGPVELAAFRAIKRGFDPDGLLNPDVMLPPPAGEEPDLTDFGEAVRMALAGGPRVLPPSAADTPRDTTVDVDAENMSLTAGGAALCRDVAAAAQAAGLSCPAMESDGVVADAIESAGHRQPARRALLGVEATLPGGYRAKFGSAAMKDVAGLDAKRLIAGGRGAFGRVERATLRAVPHRG